ncbi:unnamed protein product [Camellia sinensis]
MRRIDKNAVKFKTKPHPTLISIRSQWMTCHPLWMQKIVRTAVGCRLSNLSPTVDDCAVSVEQTPTAGLTKQKFGGNTQGQQKKGQSEGSLKLASSIENLALSVKSQQLEVRVHHDYPHLTPEVIGKWQGCIP